MNDELIELKEKKKNLQKRLRKMKNTKSKKVNERLAQKRKKLRGKIKEINDVILMIENSRQ